MYLGKMLKLSQTEVKYSCKNLFPFDGAGGFAGDVVDDAVNAADFAYDTAGDFCEEFVW